MRSRRLTFVLGFALLGAGLMVGPTSPASAGVHVPSWHVPAYLPGVPASASAVVAASCPGPGSCVAVSEWPMTSPSRVYVNVQHRGKWAPAQMVAHNLRQVSINSMSCPTIRDCVLTGSDESATQINGIILSESNSVWGSPQTVNLPPDVFGFTSSPGQVVACPSAGNCVVGGGSDFAWVMSETNGTWGVPVVLGSATAGTQPSITEEVSCWAVSACTVSGIDTGGAGVFVGTLDNGQWGGSTQIANVESAVALANNEPSAVNSISCPTAGYCMLGGVYPVDRSPNTTYAQQPFIAVENNGVWGSAEPVASVVRLNTGILGTVGYVQCWEPNRCVLAGTYTAGHLARTWFLRSQGNGWSGVIDPASTPHGQSDGMFDAFQCVSPTVCVALDTYSTANASYSLYNGKTGVFAGSVITMHSWGGRWQRAQTLYPPTSPSAWYTPAYANVLTCSPTGIYCLMAGSKSWGALALAKDQRAIVAVFS